MVFPYQLIDLTHILEPNVPTWEGTCGFSLNTDLDYSDSENEDKFCIMSMHLRAGIGTHIDAPSHCFWDGLSISDLKLDKLCLSCIVIDVSNKMHEHYCVTAEDILNFEEEHGSINSNTCVMIKTGWGKYWDSPEKYRNNLVFPTISVSAAELLLQRGVVALGIDTLSPDMPDNGFEVHQAFLGQGKILIENVANLDKVPVKGSYVMILPIKVKDATEAPVRLIALIAR